MRGQGGIRSGYLLRIVVSSPIPEVPGRKSALLGCRSTSFCPFAFSGLDFPGADLAGIPGGNLLSLISGVSILALRYLLPYWEVKLEPWVDAPRSSKLR